MKNSLELMNQGFLMDPLFDLLAGESLPEPRGFRNLDMKTDVKDEGNSYLMEVEIPGVNKINIDSEGMKQKFGLMGEPLFLGVVIGCVICLRTVAR